ncbi:hypothetical protein PHMEG_00025512 [Phytophthora megakarya]|uniref:Eukaryotic/viral aspartic protease n=1 Tax=Phytophthora megakarya TaxID=4795 RepID=A0A225VDI6_9STRA|nr:hypothetical protein PHMEG_00025512 [Phytophthora megakarya]
MERISTERHEADLDQDPDLEEKPRMPLRAAPAATADLDENRDPYTTDKEMTKRMPNPSTKSATATRSSKKKKIKATRIPTPGSAIPTISGFQAPPRVRFSAVSDLKEFTGKDMDEDRVRAWIGKVKSAFQRDQATEKEKCLTFADLMVGLAKNWHRQLSRTTKTWADLLDNFQRRSGYVSGMAVLPCPEKIRGYPARFFLSTEHQGRKPKSASRTRRSLHLDAGRSRVDRPPNAITIGRRRRLEEVFRARGRAKSRQRRFTFGSKYRQKAPASAQNAPTRAMVRAIQAQDPSSEPEGIQPGPERKRQRETGYPNVAPREAEITKTETAVRIVTQPIAVCTRVVDAGDVHETGECPMEEFYNPIRKWYDLTRHAGLFPEQIEQMTLAGVESGTTERSIYCIYAYVNKTTPDQGRKESDLRGNTCNLDSYTDKIASLLQIGEFNRSNAEGTLDFKRGESRGY